jgi:hypothetical protein
MGVEQKGVNRVLTNAGSFVTFFHTHQQAESFEYALNTKKGGIAAALFISI